MMNFVLPKLIASKCKYHVLLNISPLKYISLMIWLGGGGGLSKMYCGINMFATNVLVTNFLL